MPEFLLHSKASSTLAKYQAEWQRWKSWELDHFSTHVFPVSPQLVSVYLFDEISTSKSPHVITSALYGILWAHHMAGLQSPTDHLIVKQLAEAAKRLYGKPREPQHPISVDTLHKIAAKFGGPTCSLLDLRTCFIFFVGFAGFCVAMN